MNIQKIEHTHSISFSDSWLHRKIGWIISALAFWQILNIIGLFPEARELIGLRNFAVVKHPELSYFGTDSIFLSWFQLIRNYPRSACLVFGAVCYTAWKRGTGTKIILWPFVVIITWTLDHLVPEILDGGNNLYQLLMIYVLGTLPFLFKPTRATKVLAVGSIYLGMAQVCLMYFTAGWAKIMGSDWQSGLALFYILQNKDFSNGFFSQMVVSNFFLSSLGSYFAVCFQAAFPWLIWVPKARGPLIFLGCLLHLSIGVFMGLPLFSLIMCLSYLFFLSEKDFEAIQNGLNGQRKWIIAIDGKCKVCVVIGKCLKLMDIKNKIIIDDCWNPARESIAKIDEKARQKEMAVVFMDGQSPEEVWFGYEGIRRFTKEMLLLMPLWPILSCSMMREKGPKLYRFFAQKRSHLGCGTECSINR